MSADDVRRAWHRIDGWLAAHAPILAGWLRPPADAAAIAGAEGAVGVRFPDELRASLEVHDGQSPGASEVLGEWTLLSCADLTAAVAFLRSLGLAEAPPDVAAATAPLVAAPGVRPAWLHPAWIPFAVNGGGDYLMVDEDPAPGGAPGQVILYLHDVERRDVVAPGVAAWLDGFADELEADRYEVVGGEALWPRDLEA